MLWQLSPHEPHDLAAVARPVALVAGIGAAALSVFAPESAAESIGNLQFAFLFYGGMTLWYARVALFRSAQQAAADRVEYVERPWMWVP